jgi:hypothetical protein
MRLRSIAYRVSSSRAGVVAALLACCLAVLLAGCGSSVGIRAKPATTPTTAPTPTPAPPPKVVFQADWSHGAGNWKLPPHWSIQNGALVSDGYATENVPVPYVVNATNYQVQMTARVVDVTFKQISCNTFFGILAEDDSGARQFEAQSICFGPLPYHGDSRLTGADGSGRVWELIVGSNARTYRVNVYGNQAVYFPGGAGSIGGITNAAPISPAHLSLEASQVKLVITRFSITTI